MFHGLRRVYDQEKQYLRKDGSRVWVHVTATVHRGEEGRPLQAITLVQEIDDRKRAEEALKVSEERWRLLAEIGSELATSLALDETVTSSVPSDGSCARRLVADLLRSRRAPRGGRRSAMSTARKQ